MREKSLELRSRCCNKTGRIFLIEQGSGLITGEALLDGCIEFFDINYLARLKGQHQVDDCKILKKWNCGWALSNIKRYEKPISYVHPRGAVIWVNLSENERLNQLIKEMES